VLQECHSIRVGKECEILSNVMIAPGVQLGNRIRVAMGSVCIKQNYINGYLYAGNPAQKKKLLKKFVMKL
jgi:acetyltransferase-like isoleucine patch superfamily enzyme